MNNNKTTFKPGQLYILTKDISFKDSNTRIKTYNRGKIILFLKEVVGRDIMNIVTHYWLIDENIYTTIFFDNIEKNINPYFGYIELLK